MVGFLIDFIYTSIRNVLTTNIFILPTIFVRAVHAQYFKRGSKQPL